MSKEREQALETARSRYKAHTDYSIEHLFRGAPAVDEFREFGYRHGWFIVGEFAFCQDEITGIPYDPTQGGWAYL